MSSTGLGFSFHFKSRGYSLDQMGDKQNYKLRPMGVQFHADSVRQHSSWGEVSLNAYTYIHVRYMQDTKIIKIFIRMLLSAINCNLSVFSINSILIHERQNKIPKSIAAFLTRWFPDSLWLARLGMWPGISHLNGTVDLLLRLHRRRFLIWMDRRSQGADSRPDAVQWCCSLGIDRYRERELLLVLRRLQISYWSGFRQLHKHPADYRWDPDKGWRALITIIRSRPIDYDVSIKIMRVRILDHQFFSNVT